jgi:hypothetical protein
MIVVREFFTAKPGQASKLAAMLKDATSEWPGDVRIMTDLTGEFNQVVLETKLKDLAAWEARTQEYATNQAIREKMKGYTDMWTTGGREIYRLVE